MTRNEDDDEESTWKRPYVTTDTTAGDREFTARDAIEMESNRLHLVSRKVSRSNRGIQTVSSGCGDPQN